MPMHVLVLPSWYGTTDKPWLGTFFKSQAVALSRRGVQVGVVFVESRSLRRLTIPKLFETHFQKEISIDNGVTTLRMKGWNTLSQTLPGSRVWSTLTRHLIHDYCQRYGKPDILHAHCAFWAGSAAVDTAAGLGIPAVVTEHGSDFLGDALDSRRRQRAAEIYRRADAVLAVSGMLLSSVSAIAGCRLGPVVPNMVDTDFFTIPPTLRGSRPFTFLSVSNLVESKRIDLLIQAFARLSGGDAQARLVVAGAGPCQVALRRLAESLGIAQSVEFTGSLSPEQVRDRMWRSNALVLPSSYETFGVVLIEALATGLPVVATRCGGPQEILADGVGHLIDRNNEPQLSAALQWVMRQSPDEKRLREHVLKRFSYHAVVPQLLEVYESVLR